MKASFSKPSFSLDELSVSGGCIRPSIAIRRSTSQGDDTECLDKSLDDILHTIEKIFSGVLNEDTSVYEKECVEDIFKDEKIVQLLNYNPSWSDKIHMRKRLREGVIEYAKRDIRSIDKTSRQDDSTCLQRASEVSPFLKIKQVLENSIDKNSKKFERLAQSLISQDSTLSSSSDSTDSLQTDSEISYNEDADFDLELDNELFSEHYTGVQSEDANDEDGGKSIQLEHKPRFRGLIRTQSDAESGFSSSLETRVYSAAPERGIRDHPDGEIPGRDYSCIPQDSAKIMMEKYHRDLRGHYKFGKRRGDAIGSEYSRIKLAMIKGGFKY